MLKKITLILFVATIIVGCEKEHALEFTTENLTENDLEICEGKECPEITVDYVMASGNEKIAEEINRKIQEFVISSFSIEEEPTIVNSVKEAAENFAGIYFKDKAEFDMTGLYSAEITVREIYNSPEIISFEMYQYLYTGGAHGYGSTRFLNIDPNTGKEYAWSDIFKNTEEFTALAERKFRADKNISPDQPINEPGFWFEENTFYLPPSVGFTQDSLIFIYNQYDIASYAEGPIELKLSKEVARPYLKISEKEK